MFEKVVMKTILASCGAAAVALCGWLIHTVVQDIKEDRQFNDMMQSRKRAYSAVEEELIRRMKGEG